MFWTYIRKVLSSNLCRTTRCYFWGLSSFSSVCTALCRYGTLKYYDRLLPNTHVPVAVVLVYISLACIHRNLAMYSLVSHVLYAWMEGVRSAHALCSLPFCVGLQKLSSFRLFQLVTTNCETVNIVAYVKEITE